MSKPTFYYVIEGYEWRGEYAWNLVDSYVYETEELARAEIASILKKAYKPEPENLRVTKLRLIVPQPVPFGQMS